MALLPTPTAAPADNPGQWLPFILAAIDEALDRDDVWDDPDTARTYLDDLRDLMIQLMGS